MTIQAATARVSFPCNGVSNVFPVNIQAYFATDFLVLLTNAAGSTTLNLNSDYTLVASGSLTPTFWSLTTQTGQLISPYVTGNTLQVILNPAETQLSQYTQGQAFPSLAVQTNLDRLTQMVIRQSDQLSRAITAPDGDVSPITTLPRSALRALQYMAFDAQGNATTVTALPGSQLTQTIFNSFLATASVIGPAVTGPSLTVPSAAGWGAILAQSTIQVAGPNSLTNVNQNVNLTQLLFHGYAAEIVSINGGAGADLKVWSNYADAAGTYHFRIENDALNATSDWMKVVRTGAFGASQPSVTFPIGGAVTIAAPTATVYQLAINSGLGAGVSNGVNIGAGTGVSDHALTITNAANSLNFLVLRGDGSMGLGTAVANFGLGTLNAQGLYVNSVPALAAAATVGWGTPTGATIVSNFPGATATLAQTSGVVAELIALLKPAGLLAT